MTFSNRYFFTLFSSFVRSGLNFYVSIKVAGYLLPEFYGEYQYTLSICTSIFIFTNLSTENAFFTFIAKRKQHIYFYFTYFMWQFSQLLLVILIALMLNKELFTLIFKSANVGLVVIALGASFLVGNIQATSIHILESIRKTSYSQGLNIVISLIHFLVVMMFINYEMLTVQLLFIILLLEYVFHTIVVLFISIKFRSKLFVNNHFSLINTGREFYFYCKPLFIVVVTSFLYTFTDRWLIQTYLGSAAQAYFSISIQFSTLIILLTTSVVNIFWKEISESIQKGNSKKTRKYYLAVSEHLFIISCVMSSLLFFYSDQLLKYFYQDEYLEASSVFKLIMLYPILQSMGQLYSVFCLAASKTTLIRNISVGISILSILFAVLLLADFGLGFGVEGIAIKLLIMSLLSCFIFEYYIGKYLQILPNYFTKLKIIILSFCTSYSIMIFQMYFELPFLYQIILVGSCYILPLGIYLLNSMQREISRI